jgi:hypothetical protein
MITLFWRLVAKLLARPTQRRLAHRPHQAHPVPAHHVRRRHTEIYMGRSWLFNPYSRETHKPAPWWCT